MTFQHPFDTAIALTSDGENRYLGQTSPTYGNMMGPFGGITSAIMLNAVLSHPERRGDPVTITVNLCAAVQDGPFEVRVTLKRAGKYLQHWSVDQWQGDRLCTTALVVMANRTDSFTHQPATMPQTLSYADSQVIDKHPPLPWLKAYDFRFAEGPPLFMGVPDPADLTARTLQYVADKPARPLDHLSLLAISDSFILRLLLVRPKFVPAGTVSLTTHFIAGADEIAAQGTAPLLGMADAHRFHGNFHDQIMQLWGADETLLATGTQVVWYKE